MTGSGEEVGYDRVKVLRVRLNGLEKHPVRTRRDRVLVWLTDPHEMLTEPSGKRREEIRRRAGDVAWRTASQHQIDNLSSEGVELIIVEVKS